MSYWMYLPEKCTCGRNATLRRYYAALEGLRYERRCGREGERWPEEHIASATFRRSPQPKTPNLFA